jgi:hypothetical protein
MPFFFYLPFIIASGMFSVATDSLQAKPKNDEAKRAE